MSGPDGMMSEQEIDKAVYDEVQSADDRYGRFRSSHEGLGVLIEEVDEIRRAIHANAPESIRQEAIQIAAVAIRIARSMSDESTLSRSGWIPK